MNANPRQIIEPELDNLTFTYPLEPGTTRVPGNKPSLSFDFNSKRVSIPISKLLPGQQLAFSYVIQVAASKNNDVRGNPGCRLPSWIQRMGTFT